MKSNKRVDVCIPTYYPNGDLIKIFDRLKKQTYSIGKLLICNTGRDGWTDDIHNALVKSGLSYELFHILPEEFDHGAVRDKLIRRSGAELVLFMTQDAYPYDNKLIAKLVEVFEDETVAAAYGRQLPKASSDILERYSRRFNYPEKSVKKTKADLDKLGIKTFFCSNVCAMYRRDIYLSGEGFPPKTIFNEDMIHAKSLIDRGYAIYYQSEAKVYHSHNYSLMRQLHRNFDLAYSQKQYPEVFDCVSSESEGLKYVKNVLGGLAKRGHFIAGIRFILQCFIKYTGFFLGKRADKLPKRAVLWLSDNKHFFNENS